MSRPQNVCIYCGGAGRTKEHYWGKWLTKHLRDKNPRTDHKVILRDPETGLETVHQGALTRQGSLRRQQIKGPCVRCNNKWMREVNEAAEETIIALIKRGPFNMSDDQRHAFAMWATMMSMTYEFADVNTIASTGAERRELMETHSPPAIWAVLIGSYGGGQWAEIHNHRRLRSVSVETGEISELFGQANLFTLGKTAVNTISRVAQTEQELIFYAAWHELFVVWPMIDNDPSLGTHMLTDDEMWTIAHQGV